MVKLLRALPGALLMLVSLLALTGAGAQTGGIAISVDAAANRHAIDPRIYGAAYATPTALADLNAPLHRYGGNNSSRYNWQLNADNRGQDWYFESIGDNSAVAGQRGDQFIQDSKTGGAEAMLTIPMLPWVAKLGANRSKLAGFSIQKYGPQTGSDAQWFPDAGNGILSATGKNVTGNDPNDANVPSTAAFQQGWVQHLVQTWGTAGAGGLRYYILDNEPSIWQSTHRDVHPDGPGMDEIRDRMIAYGKAVKDVDPNALVVGPEEWGWSGYFLSGKDQQAGPSVGWDWSKLPDRTAHGGADYLPWLLDQLRQQEVTGGRRLLDVFTVHYYPQGGEFGNDTSIAMQQRRNRSTRSLWDSAYVDETWINDKVQLIPRIKGWVNTFYPGLQVGVTEYNWGAEGHINGATTQADVLGIFGREGLDLATRWTTPDPASPTFKAMKLYRSYDGLKNGFGETSVKATAPNPDNVSSFAALRAADGALTLVLINKQIGVAQAATVNLANFIPASAAQRWQLTSTNQITRTADLGLTGPSFSISLPAQSITLLVIPAGGGNPPPGPTFTSSASANPASVLAGAATTLSATVTCTSGTLDSGAVNLDVYDPNGVKVAGQQWTAQSFATGEQKSFNFSWTAPQTAGTYSMRVSVTGAGGSPLLHSNDAAGSVTVTAPALAFTSSASASPASLPVSQATAITATVTCTGGSLSNGVVDVEVYDSAGGKVGQQFWEGESFAAAQQKTYTYNWTAPGTPGTYTVMIGVFTTGWASNPHWNGSAGAVTVTGATPTFTSSASVSPASVPSGQTTTVTATVTCTAGGLNGGVIDVEVYNAGGTQVAQRFWSPETLAVNQQKTYSFTWTAPATTGTYTVKVGVFGPNWAPNYHWNNSAGTVAVTQGQVPNSGTGLKGEYYANNSLTSPVTLTRTDTTVNFTWGTAAPVNKIPKDNFSVRWSGQVEAPVSGSYTFSTVSDEGIRLWVNGQLLMDDWIAHTSRERAGTPITLAAGQRYTIRIDYYEKTGSATARLLWAYPGQAKVVVPKGRLYPAP